MNQKKQKEYNMLTKEEKKIYDSIMINFPATSHESALDHAWQGGANFQYNFN